jgi:hypothetical protein
MNFKKLKPVDYIIIGSIAFVLIIGFLVMIGKNKFSKSPVEETRKIAFQVMLRSVSITDNVIPFKIGEEAFITIRNVPYTKLEIIDSKISPKKAMIPTGNNAKPFILVEDIAQPYQFDAIVTLIDEAKITKDGAVVGGNKIKIGLPIVLEGFNYRVGGTISNVQLLDDADIKTINEYVEQQKALLKLQETQMKKLPKVQIVNRK